GWAMSTERTARARHMRNEREERIEEEREERAEAENARRRRSARERGRAEHENAFERAEDKGEDLAESAGDKLWRALRRRPYLGVAVTAAGGVWLASVIGVAELAFGAAVGYATYLILKKRMSPSRALRETIRIRKRG